MIRNVIFLTEIPHEGKIHSKVHDNMRTDAAWMHALDATNIHIRKPVYPKDESVTHVFIILPKVCHDLVNRNVVEESQQAWVNAKVICIQEGTRTTFQNYSTVSQIWTVQMLQSCDMIAVHNDCDLEYFQHFNPNCKVIPSIYIPDAAWINLVHITKSGDKIFIGGNFAEVYHGMDAYYAVLKAGFTDISMMSSGRRQSDEEHYVKLVPWMNWSDFNNELCKYDIGMNFTKPSAGSFQINCAIAGIPCVGNVRTRTQRDLFPKLAVSLDEPATATTLLRQLKTDPDFRKETVDFAKANLCKFKPQALLDFVDSVDAHKMIPNL